MIEPDGAPAHWLNEVILGKHLREPINVIILDSAARSASEAKDRLLRALAQAGFPGRLGHSGGYSAIIGSIIHGQLTDGSSGTFADEPFEFNNDHGRIFGPFAFRKAYVWTAAFSREKVAPFSEVRHKYVSFNQGRDAFLSRMTQKTSFQHVDFIRLDNMIRNDSLITTGDHDGLAALLVAAR
jgi:hypothetical protein